MERGSVGAAEALARHAHRDQVDKAGVPYVDHLSAVVDNCRGALGYLESRRDPSIRQAIASIGREKVLELALATAWLHDIVEDQGVTIEELEAYGFDARVVEAVDSVTRLEGEKESAYIGRVMKGWLSRLVKMADQTHNMDLARLPRISDRDLKRQARYASKMSKIAATGDDGTDIQAYIRDFDANQSA